LGHVLLNMLVHVSLDMLGHVCFTHFKNKKSVTEG
jgi:hypothetical protein